MQNEWDKLFFWAQHFFWLAKNYFLYVLFLTNSFYCFSDFSKPIHFLDYARNDSAQVISSVVENERGIAKSYYFKCITGINVYKIQTNFLTFNFQTFN